MSADNDPPFVEPIDRERWGDDVDFFGTPYDVPLEPAETSGGKELVSKNPEKTSDKYAGATVRREFEQHAIKSGPNDPPALWFGNGFSGSGLRSRAAGSNFEDLFTHNFITATTGAGKSTILKNTLVQLAYGGWGFCFIDPGADTYDNLIASLPEHRLDDVIYITPPTGEYDRVSAINLLEVPEFEGEPQARHDARISQTIQQNVGIFCGTEDSYARIKRVLKAVQRSMIEADEQYTPMSIYKFLQDEELQDEFAQYVNDGALEEYMENLAELDQMDLEPVIGRFDKWVHNKVARRVISHKRSSINISQAVEEGKIIIVNTKVGEVGEDVAKSISTAVVQRIWAAVQARTANTSEPEQRRPFFLAIDELDDAVPEDSPIDSMLENARKYRLALFLATQDPRQLPDKHEKAVKRNTTTKVVGKIPDDDSAYDLAGELDGVDPDDIKQLPEYNAYMNLSTDTGASVPVRVNLFPPYPPLRSKEEVDEVIERSLDKYGVDPSTGVPYDSTMISQVVRGDGVVSTGASEIDTSTFLEAIDAVELFTAAQDDGAFVSLDDVAGEVDARTDVEVSARQLEKAVVELPDTFVDTESVGEDSLRVALTEKGRSEVRDTATGAGSSAGGAKHQLLLQEARNLFTRLHCSVDIPDQDVFDGSPPDGIAELPIPREPPIGELDIDLEGSTVGELTPSELEQVQAAMQEYQDGFADRLAGKHDALPVVSGGRDMFLEAESSTRTRPALTLRNLRKAVNHDYRCVFVTRGVKAKDTVVRSLNEPPFISGREDGERVLYTGDQEFRVGDPSDGFVAVRSADAARATWRDTAPTRGNTDADAWGVRGDHEFVLETTGGDEVLRVTADDVATTELGKGVCDAWGGYDEERGEWVVFTVDDAGAVDTRVYDDRDAFYDDWTEISRPFVPELMFDERPGRDDWCVVVLPSDAEAALDAPHEFHIDEHGEEVQSPIRVDGWGTESDGVRAGSDSSTSDSDERKTGIDRSPGEADDTIIDTDAGQGEETGDGNDDTASESEFAPDTTGDIAIPDEQESFGDEDDDQVRGEAKDDSDSEVMDIEDPDADEPVSAAAVEEYMNEQGSRESADSSAGGDPDPNDAWSDEGHGDASGEDSDREDESVDASESEEIDLGFENVDIAGAATESTSDGSSNADGSDCEVPGSSESDPGTDRDGGDSESEDGDQSDDEDGDSDEWVL